MTSIKALLFQSDDSSLAGIHESDSDNMTVAEKMDLWEETSKKGEAEPDDSETRQLAHDNQKESGKLPELPKYSDLILASDAYRWFISRLKMECTLESGETDTQPTIRQIRHAALEHLPTDIISKYRAPLRHCVTFKLSLQTLQDRLLYERSKGNEHVKLSELVTITYSSGVAQVTRVRDYIQKMWSSGGDELLSFLESLFHGDDWGVDQIGALQYNSRICALLTFTKLSSGASILSHYFSMASCS